MQVKGLEYGGRGPKQVGTAKVVVQVKGWEHGRDVAVPGEGEGLGRNVGSEVKGVVVWIVVF